VRPRARQPELWRGAWRPAGLCARVRACAGAAESLHTYIHSRLTTDDNTQIRVRMFFHVLPAERQRGDSSKGRAGEHEPLPVNRALLELEHIVYGEHRRRLRCEEGLQDLVANAHVHRMRLVRSLGHLANEPHDDAVVVALAASGVVGPAGHGEDARDLLKSLADGDLGLAEWSDGFDEDDVLDRAACGMDAGCGLLHVAVGPHRPAARLQRKWRVVAWVWVMSGRCACKG